MGTFERDDRVIRMDDMARVWPIVCQFGIGALLCGVGLWAGFSGGYLDLKLRDHRRMLAVIVGGFVGLLALYCAFTFWLPFVGGGDGS